MPYINPEARPLLNDFLTRLIEHLSMVEERKLDGDMNYIITRLLHLVYSESYFDFNRAIGVLESVKQEFYRRRVGPYEDRKIAENGDVE